MRVELSVCAALKVFCDGKYSRADRRNPHICGLNDLGTENAASPAAATVIRPAS